MFRIEDRTRKLWAKQNQHEGDREGLFTTIAAHVDVARVLYPGSYVDIAASQAFAHVTYADTDDRAAQFFADPEGVAEIIGRPSATASFEFLHADYRWDLDLTDESFDLLISLYAGFVSEHCTRYLAVGGTLLVNPSHGDVAMASIDRRYRLSGVVLHRSGEYRVSDGELAKYLVAKKPDEITVEGLHERGHGIAYTTSPFAYLFERIR